PDTMPGNLYVPGQLLELFKQAHQSGTDNGLGHVVSISRSAETTALRSSGEPDNSALRTTQARFFRSPDQFGVLTGHELQVLRGLVTWPRIGWPGNNPA